jgi:hypothetical protein
MGFALDIQLSKVAKVRPECMTPNIKLTSNNPTTKFRSVQV